MNELPSDDGVTGDENKNLIAKLHVELDPSKRITAEQQLAVLWVSNVHHAT